MTPVLRVALPGQPPVVLAGRLAKIFALAFAHRERIELPGCTDVEFKIRREQGVERVQLVVTEHVPRIDLREPGYSARNTDSGEVMR